MAKKNRNPGATSEAPTVDRDGPDMTAEDVNADPPNPDATSEDPKVTLKKACATWEKQTALMADLESDRAKTEANIVAALVAIGVGSRSQPTIKLGGVPHRARRSKDRSEPPRLVKLADLTSIDLD